MVCSLSTLAIVLSGARKAFIRKGFDCPFRVKRILVSYIKKKKKKNKHITQIVLIKLLKRNIKFFDIANSVLQ